MITITINLYDRYYYFLKYYFMIAIIINKKKDIQNQNLQSKFA